MIGNLNKVFSRAYKTVFAGALMAGIAAAVQSTATFDMTANFSALCVNIQSIVPIVAFMMMLLGGVLYAVGQIMGAETRARANVWATAMLTGGIFGLIIAASAPYVLSFFATSFGNTTMAFTCQAVSYAGPPP